MILNLRTSALETLLFNMCESDPKRPENAPPISRRWKPSKKTTDAYWNKPLSELTHPDIITALNDPLIEFDNYDDQTIKPDFKTIAKKCLDKGFIGNQGWSYITKNALQIPEDMLKIIDPPPNSSSGLKIADHLGIGAMDEPDAPIVQVPSNNMFTYELYLHGILQSLNKSLNPNVFLTILNDNAQSEYPFSITPTTADIIQPHQLKQQTQNNLEQRSIEYVNKLQHPTVRHTLKTRNDSINFDLYFLFSNKPLNAKLYNDLSSTYLFNKNKSYEDIKCALYMLSEFIKINSESHNAVLLKQSFKIQ